MGTFQRNNHWVSSKQETIGNQFWVCGSKFTFQTENINGLIDQWEQKNSYIWFIIA